jgi:hypothetical protein
MLMLSIKGGFLKSMYYMPYKTPYLLHKTKGDRKILIALLNSVWKNKQKALKRLHMTKIVFTSVMCGRLYVHQQLQTW